MIVSLRPDVAVRRSSAGDIVVATGDRELTFDDLPAPVSVTLSALFAGRALAGELASAIMDTGGADALESWNVVLRLLGRAGALQYSVEAGGRVIATMTPASPGFDGDLAPPHGRVVLSRFASVRRDCDRLVFESPLASAQVDLLDLLAVVVVAAFARPTTVELVARELDVTDAAVVGALTGMFRAAGLVTDVRADGTAEEDNDAALRSWDLTDLVLHQRSRGDRLDLRLGATFRLEGVLPPLPALKAPMSQTRISLHRPDIDELRRHDMSLTSAIEERTSIRRHGATPISVRKLGEFLYRVAGLRPARDANDEQLPYQARHRVYPGAGLCHPLEFYAAVGRCDGLAPGLYHYDPGAHVLESLPSRAEGAASLLDGMSAYMQNREPPQVLLVLTARFGRMSWKYEGIAYALLLKEVGVIFEAMYLVATAMGLAPCAIGSGDATAFARMIGTDPLEESSVGEFMLGSR